MRHELIRPGSACRGLKGTYRITKHVATSGMGHVYEAAAPGGDPVIIKFPASTAKGKPVDPQLYVLIVEKLKVEAQVLRNFTSSSAPCIVKYVDESADPGMFFLVIQRIAGSTLSRTIPSTGLPERQVISMSIDILRGLEFIHKHNTVYRDMKPDNIMVQKDGSCVIIDFGGAKQGVTQTAGGMHASTAIFTPAWSCPHQPQNRVSAECDLYSFGKVMFYMGTRFKPERFQDKAGRMTKKMRDIQPGTSADLSELVSLTLDPEHNTVHTASDMIAELRRIQQPAGRGQSRLLPQRQPQQQQQQQQPPPLQQIPRPAPPAQRHPGQAQIPPSQQQQQSPPQSQPQQLRPRPAPPAQRHPGQAHPESRIVLQGVEYRISNAAGGSLIGKKHDEAECQKSGGGCNLYGRGRNIFVGWDCPGRCACVYNPGHWIGRHHMRVWRDTGGRICAVNNDPDRRSAINRQGIWTPISYHKKEVLKDHDRVALLYNEKKGSYMEFTFYER